MVIESRARPLESLHPVLWWPTPGAANFDDESVPAPVVKAYDEGVRCLSIQVPNAAAAMLRSALAQVVQDKGSEAARDKKTLNDAIKQMVSEQTLPPVFKDWAEHIKNMGNAGAHPEIFGAVTMEEAEDLRALVLQLLRFLYVQPAALEKARKGRSGFPAKKAATASVSSVDHGGA
ncbi:DUF4145 domain-containing protein [Georgenia sp. SUBG003]|uniref:DUF4145 domain-containing protein n=1 Tax=Georgenia sp. SUBG003 TaxID=1497974 RepID=UPI003AB1F2B9